MEAPGAETQTTLGAITTITRMFLATVIILNMLPREDNQNKRPFSMKIARSRGISSVDQGEYGRQGESKTQVMAMRMESDPRRQFPRDEPRPRVEDGDISVVSK